MDLKDYLTISGQSGLFKFIAQGRNGIIVESLMTGKRTFATAANKISMLEDIAVFTKDGEIPLKEVFELIFKKENGGPSIDYKSPDNELKKYMLEVVPDYDTERVYLSDIKKIINWYNILQEKNLLSFEDETENQIQNDEINEIKENPPSNDENKNSTES